MIRPLWMSLKRQLRRGLEYTGYLLTYDHRRLTPEMHARDFLDLRLQPYLPAKGFFIEAGGFDGLTASNTYYLESVKGWSGLLVEPDPEYCALCRSNRPHCLVENVALVPLDYTNTRVQFVIQRDRSMSYTSATPPGNTGPLASVGQPIPSITVDAIPLTTLLHRHGISHVDFLSLDVEGNELAVLRGVDFDRITIDAILVECLSAQGLQEVTKFLRPTYRLRSALSQRDYLFTRCRYRQATRKLLQHIMGG